MYSNTCENPGKPSYDFGFEASLPGKPDGALGKIYFKFLIK